LLAALLVAWLWWGIPAWGQETATGWSRPVNLSNSQTLSIYPSIAADPAGGIHVIWSEGNGQDDVIYYTRWEDGRWTKPVDILLNPDGGAASYPVMVADDRGYLHVVWKGGATIYYSRAYAPAAGSARNWSTPQPLTFPYSYLNFPDLALTPDGILHLVYSEQIGPASGIYYLRSTGHGEKWTTPTAVYQNSRADRLVDKARIAAGPDGILHVVWVETRYPETFPPLGIRYARSEDQGATWDGPVTLADGPYDDPDILALGQEVHVVYSGTAEDRYKFHRWSSDGGKTWSEAWRNPEVGGLLGWPALVADGETLHWLQAGSIFAIGTDGLYETTRTGGTWSPGQVPFSNTCGCGQNMANVSAVMVGKELHVVISAPLAREEGGWQMDIFYLRCTFGPPGRPAPTLPPPTFPPPAAPTFSPQPTFEPTVLPALPPHAGPIQPAIGDTAGPVILGLLPVLAMLGFCLALYRRRRFR